MRKYKKMCAGKIRCEKINSDDYSKVQETVFEPFSNFWKYKKHATAGFSRLFENVYEELEKLSQKRRISCFSEIFLGLRKFLFSIHDPNSWGEEKLLTLKNSSLCVLK